MICIPNGRTSNPFTQNTYLELMQQMLKIDCDVAARELGISNEIASLIIALKPAELEALVERLTQARPAAPVPSP
ncbi:flagellar transcriptional regulator FlhD [Burkholderia vietnamiensis]|uniref:Flagellar transcriptional regulator FlhD n=2 Tax=Burkholderia vietnamiensis TaxID=60552 RepID=A0AA45BG90_BURVI|nr:flagellar transcriptional regulator FlhD [Burkholderia vietnamiensis]